MRRDVYHYFQQAYRRTLDPAVPPPLVARQVVLDDAEASFAVRLGSDGRVASVVYRCTTCMTLLALCEHVAEELRGATLDQARSLCAEDLLRKHPEIPVSRQSRARLAVAAAQTAMENLPA